MKRIFGFLFLIFGLATSAFAQELSEGDLFMQGLSAEEKAALLSGNSSFTYEEEFVVDDLFTRLPFDEVKAKAKAEKKIYYVDFSAEWCQPCKLMNQTTFRDFHVVTFTHENFYAVQLDMSDFDAIEMQAKYNIKALPTVLFFDHNSNLIDRTTGLQTGTLFLTKLQEIKSNF